MASRVIENLITQFTFVTDEKTLKKINKGIDDAVKGLTAIVVVATAAAGAVGVFTKKIAESHDQLAKLSRITGVDVKALQELGFVAELGGASVDSMNGSLKNLSKIASEAARGMGSGVEVFGMLGISATDAAGRIKSANDLLLDISDSISKLKTTAEQLEFTAKLGISEDLLPALQKGSEAIRQQRKEARELGFVIDKDAAAAAEEFVDVMLKVKKIVGGVASAIGTKLIKNAMPMLKIFIEWFKVNKQLIKQNVVIYFNKIKTVSKAVLNIMKRVADTVLFLVDAMGGWKNTIIAVSALLLAMNASALLMPILAIAAGAAILLILEDIKVFAEGGDSAIGNLIERLPVLEGVLRGLINIFELVKKGWELIFSEELFFALEGLKMLIQDIGSAIKNEILKPFKSITGFINTFSPVDLVKLKSGIDTYRASRKSSGGNSSTITNNTTNKPNINININGGNTQEVRKAVSDVLSEQYSGAQTNLNSEVD